MEQWPLGVFASVDAGLGVPLSMVSALGVNTVHLHAPKRESRTAVQVAEICDELATLDVKLTCMFAGFAGESYADIPTVRQTVGLAPPATRAARTVELKAIADFAQELGVAAVGLHLGFVPHETGDAEYRPLVAVTREVCDYCATNRQVVHLETGQEPADVLLRFLGDVGRQNLFVNFDPANMILYGVGEPLSALKLLGPHVQSVHCKDAVWSPHPGETWGREVPVGQGDVNFPAFLSTLAQIGYDGPLTIEREIPHEPDRQRSELASAVELLNRLKRNIIQL